jgi:hypothetical protein
MSVMFQCFTPNIQSFGCNTSKADVSVAMITFRGGAMTV